MHPYLWEKNEYTNHLYPYSVNIIEEHNQYTVRLENVAALLNFAYSCL